MNVSSPNNYLINYLLKNVCHTFQYGQTVILVVDMHQQLPNILKIVFSKVTLQPPPSSPQSPLDLPYRYRLRDPRVLSHCPLQLYLLAHFCPCQSSELLSTAATYGWNSVGRLCPYWPPQSSVGSANTYPPQSHILANLLSLWIHCHLGQVLLF